MEADIDQIKRSVYDAVKMRPPKFDDERVPGQTKVSAFEDYLLESAWMRAELEEALYWLNALVAHFKAEVDKITGYEVALPRKPQDRITQQDVLAAKRTINSVVFESGAEAKQLRETALRQINRFEFEAQWVISRAYTMVSGG